MWVQIDVRYTANPKVELTFTQATFWVEILSTGEFVTWSPHMKRHTLPDAYNFLTIWIDAAFLIIDPIDKG